MNFCTVNPATLENIKSYTFMEQATAGSIVESAAEAQKVWAKKSLDERASCFKKSADILRSKKREFAELMTEEMGKPLLAAGAEIDKCAWGCEYFLDYATDFLAPQYPDVGLSKSTIYFEPLGVILAIMPWNFPFWQVFRFAAPSLMAGNGAILKHSPNTTGCALAIESVFKEAGFPENLFRTVVADLDVTGTLIDHKDIAAVTLTGSTRAGKAVAARAGANLKKTVLELGGSDPYVVLADADLDEAVEACVASRLNNTGQTCIAAKRIIVDNLVYDSFLEKVLTEIKKYPMGDPLNAATKLGPLARMDLKESLKKQVNQTVKEGADLVYEGDVPNQDVCYYPLTVLSDVTERMVAFNEELFGPVITLIRAKDEADAIRLANQSDYGLGGAVFTKDKIKGEHLARKDIQTGSCFVNMVVKSDPRLPFGGIKQSGYGRELAVFGMYEFVNIKTVCVK